MHGNPMDDHSESTEIGKMETKDDIMIYNVENNAEWVSIDKDSMESLDNWQ